MKVPSDLHMETTGFLVMAYRQQSSPCRLSLLDGAMNLDLSNSYICFFTFCGLFEFVQPEWMI